MLPQSLRAVVAGLRGKLPKEINLPASITVPFGSFEEVLKQANNNEVKKELDAASKDIPVEKAEEALYKCRELVMQIHEQPSCIAVACVLASANEAG